MTEYNKMAKGSFISNGLAKIINLPFQPDWVELYNYTVASSAAAQSIGFGRWDSCLPQGTAIVQGYNVTPALIFDQVAANGISTFSAGQLLQFGPVVQHGGSPVSDFSISKANPAVVTTVGNHGLTSGDVIIFEGLYATSTTGMPQIAGIPFTVTVLSDTTFSIPWNTNQSSYDIFNTATAGSFGSYKKVLYPYLYFPGTAFISAITLGSTTLVDTTDAHNFVVGQEVAFRIPSSPAFNWGTVELNSLPNIPIPGSPIYGYVVEVVDYNTVRVNIDSTSFTAFNSNPTVAVVPGLSWPQIVAVGDVNTGGVAISAGSALYPPPYYVPIGDGSAMSSGAFTARVNTINGPAIRGAYVNNTSQGFVIGAGVGDVITAGKLVGADGDRIHWRAYYHDISSCAAAPLVLP